MKVNEICVEQEHIKDIEITEEIKISNDVESYDCSDEKKHYKEYKERLVKLVLKGKNTYRINGKLMKLNGKLGRLTDTKNLYIDIGMSKALKNKRRSEIVVISNTPDKVISNYLEYKAYIGGIDRDGNRIVYKPRKGRPPKINEIKKKVDEKWKPSSNKIVFNGGTNKEKTIDIGEIESFKNIYQELKDETTTLPDLIDIAIKDLDKDGKKEALRKLKIAKEKQELKLAEFIISLYANELQNKSVENSDANALIGNKCYLKEIWGEEKNAFSDTIIKIKQENALSDDVRDKSGGYGDYNLYLNPNLKPNEKLRIVARHEAKLKAEEKERLKQERLKKEESKKLLVEIEKAKAKREEANKNILSKINEILLTCKNCNEMLNGLHNRIEKNISQETIKSGILQSTVLFDVNIESLEWNGQELEDKEPPRYVELKKDIIFIGDYCGRDKVFSQNLINSLTDIETTVIGREKNTVIVVGKNDKIKAYVTSKKIGVYIEQLKQENVAGLIIA